MKENKKISLIRKFDKMNLKWLPLPVSRKTQQILRGFNPLFGNNFSLQLQFKSITWFNINLQSFDTHDAVASSSKKTRVEPKHLGKKADSIVFSVEFGNGIF